VVDTADLILHPVRPRVLQAFLGRGQLTTADLRDQLPDVPTATLYRQFATLVRAGILKVVQERGVRGAVERTYALDLPRARVDPDEVARMTREDHRGLFRLFGRPGRGVRPVRRLR
jgi:hypothetical protein